MKNLIIVILSIVATISIYFNFAQKVENRQQRLELCAKSNEVTMLNDSINVLKSDFDYFNNFTAILEKKVLKLKPTNKDFNKVNDLILSGKYKNLTIY